MGGAHLPWGALHPPWLLPPLKMPSPRAGAPQGAYIKGGGRAATLQPLAPPSSPATPLPLAEARRSPAAIIAASTTTSSCCWIFINLSFPLAGSRRRRRLPSRTCVERGGAVRSALVIGDLDHVEYDYIITLQASARDLQVVCRCKLSPLTRCLDELIDGSW